MKQVRLGIEGSTGCLGLCKGGETIPDKTCQVTVATLEQVTSATAEEGLTNAFIWVEDGPSSGPRAVRVTYRVGRTVVHSGVPGASAILTSTSLLLPDRPSFERVHGCVTRLLPALRFLSRDLASRPEFLDEDHATLLLGPLLEERELVVCRAQGGLMLVAKDGRRGGLRRSVLHVNCDLGRLEMCDPLDLLPCEPPGASRLKPAAPARPVPSLPDAMAAFLAESAGPLPSGAPLPATPEKSAPLAARRSALPLEDPEPDPSSSSLSSSSSPGIEATSPSFTGARSDWNRSPLSSRSRRVGKSEHRALEEPSPALSQALPESLTARDVAALLSSGKGGHPSWTACCRAVRFLDNKRAALAAVPQLGSSGGALWGSEWAEGGVIEALVAFLARYSDLDPERPPALPLSAQPPPHSTGHAAVSCLTALVAGSPPESEAPRRFVDAASSAMSSVSWCGSDLPPVHKSARGAPPTSPKPKSARPPPSKPSGAWLALAVSECLAFPPVAALCSARGEGLGLGIAVALGSALGFGSEKAKAALARHSKSEHAGFSSLPHIDSPEALPSPPGLILGTPDKKGTPGDKYKAVGPETPQRELFPASPPVAKRILSDSVGLSDARVKSSLEASSSSATFLAASNLFSSGRFNSGRAHEDRAMRRAQKAAAQARPLPLPGSESATVAAPSVRGSLVAPLALSSLKAGSVRNATGPPPTETARHVALLAGEGLVAADLAAIIAIKQTEPSSSREPQGVTPKSTSRSGRSRASSRPPHSFQDVTLDGASLEPPLPDLQEDDLVRTLLAASLASVLASMPTPPAYLANVSDVLAAALSRGTGQREARMWSKEGTERLEAPRCPLDPRVRAEVLRLFCECQSLVERGRKAETSSHTPRTSSEGGAAVPVAGAGFSQEASNALLMRIRSNLAAAFPPSVPSPSFGVCVASLGAAREFLRSTSQLEAPEEAVEVLSGFLSRCKLWLESQGRPTSWSYGCLRLMDAWLGLTETLCRKATSMPLRNCLAAYLVGCRPNRVLIREFARTLMLGPSRLGLPKDLGPDLQVMLARALAFYRSLTRLVGTLPEGMQPLGGGGAHGANGHASVSLVPLTTARMMRSSTSDPRQTLRPGQQAAAGVAALSSSSPLPFEWATDESCAPLSIAPLRQFLEPGRCPLVGATWALGRLAFLVEPPDGLTLEILSPGLSEGKEAPSQPQAASPASTSVKLAALSLASELLSVPHSPFATNRVLTDTHVRASFVQFVRLYHCEAPTSDTWELCEAYLHVLTALASSKAGIDVRRRFYQLHVLEFLAREVGAEWAVQSAPVPNARSPLPGDLKEGADDGSKATSAGVPRISVPLNSRPSMTVGAGTPTAIPRLRLGGMPSNSGLGHSAGPSSADQPSLAATPGSGVGPSRPRLPIPAIKVPEALTSPQAGLRGVTPKSVTGGRPPPVPTLSLAPTPGSDVATPNALNFTFGSQLTPMGGGATSSHSSRRPSATPLSSQPLDLEDSDADSTPRAFASCKQPGDDAASETASEDWEAIMERMRRFGVQFTGDLEEDLDLLEELEERERRGELTFPALPPAPEETVTLQPTPITPVTPELVTNGAKDGPGGMFGGVPKLALDTLGGGRSSYRGAPGAGGSSAAPTVTDRDRFSTATPTPRDARGRTLEFSPPAPGLALPPVGSRAVPSLNLRSPLDAAGPGPSSRRNQGSDRSRGTSRAGVNPGSSAAYGGVGALSAWEKHYRAGDKAALARGPLHAFGSLDDASDPSRSAADTSRNDLAFAARYDEEREKRPMYQDRGLHLALVRLLLSLLLTPSGSLDPLTTGQFPVERHLPNVLFLLHHHLNHADNAFLLPGLLQWAQSEEEARGAAVLRLLRLLNRSLFRSSTYSEYTRIGRGAFAQVFRCGLPPVGFQPAPSAVLKVMDLPTGPADHCTQHDAFNEARILEELRTALVPSAASPSASVHVPVTQLIDYGVTREGIFVVLKDYKCSLRDWRRRHLLGMDGARAPLRLYLRVFRQCAEAVAALHAAGCIHFDLKADNILLEALPGCSEEDFWRPSRDEPPFRVVLADFGESKLIRGDEAPSTTRNRGTECIKSPEMLLIAHASQGAAGVGMGAGQGARASHSLLSHSKSSSSSYSLGMLGAGTSSDVWSLGCLLWEVLTGDFLFADPDWIRFFLRVTQTAHPLLDKEREAELRLLGAEAGPRVASLLLEVLQRDPSERPTASQVAKDTAALVAGLPSSQTPYSRPALRLDADRDGPSDLESSPRSFLRTPPRRDLREEDLAPLLAAPAAALASSTSLPVDAPLPAPSPPASLLEVSMRPVRVAKRLLLSPSSWLAAHAEDLALRNIGQVVMLAPPHVPFGSRAHAEVQSVWEACRIAGVRFLLVACRPLGDEESASKAALRSGPGNLVEALTRSIRELRYVQGVVRSQMGTAHAAAAFGGGGLGNGGPVLGHEPLSLSLASLSVDESSAPQALLTFTPGLSAEAVMVAVAHKALRGRVSVFEALRRAQLAVPWVSLRPDHLGLVALWQEELARQDGLRGGGELVACRCGACAISITGLSSSPERIKCKLPLHCEGSCGILDCASVVSHLDALHSALDGEYGEGIEAVDPVREGLVWAQAREGDLTVGLVDPLEEQPASDGTVDVAPDWTVFRCGICRTPLYLVMSEGGGAGVSGSCGVSGQPGNSNSPLKVQAAVERKKNKVMVLANFRIGGGRCGTGVRSGEPPPP